MREIEFVPWVIGVFDMFDSFCERKSDASMDDYRTLIKLIKTKVSDVHCLMIEEGKI